MLRKLSTLLPDAEGRKLSDDDVRHFVQGWLRQATRLNQVDCERYHGGVAYVRSPSPAVRAAVKLLEFDLQQAVQRECGRKLTQLTIQS